MTNEQNKLIAERLAGYEVQVSPAGKHYIVTDEGTMPMPDFETDATETSSTVEALCKSRDWLCGVDRLLGVYSAYVNNVSSTQRTITAAFAHCLLQIAEGEE